MLLRSFALFSLYLTCVLLTSCHAQQFQCGFQNFNFSSLAGQIYTGSDPTYTYTLDICQDFTSGSPVNPTCDGDGGICQSPISAPSEASSLGDWSNAAWSSLVINNQTVGAQASLISSSDSCWNGSGMELYQSTIQFVCPTNKHGKSKTARANTNTMTVKQTGACGFLFTIETSLACDTPPVTNCAFEGRDFSSLAGKVFTGQDSAYTYQFTPCNNLVNSACTDASICQTTDSAPSSSFALGTFNSLSSWGFIDPSSPAAGVALNMLGPQNCWSGQGATYYNSTVLFECSQNPSTTMQVSSNGVCNFQFVIPTPLACPP